MDKVCAEYLRIEFFVTISCINILPVSSPVKINLPSSRIIPVDIFSVTILLNLDISVSVKTSYIDTSLVPNILTKFLFSPLQQQILEAVVGKIISFVGLYFLKRFCSGFL